MSRKAKKVSMADTGSAGAVEETAQREASQRTGEGIGVFRALLLTSLFYIAFGFLVWFVWHTFTHMLAH